MHRQPPGQRRGPVARGPLRKLRAPAGRMRRGARGARRHDRRAGQRQRVSFRRGDPVPRPSDTSKPHGTPLVSIALPYATHARDMSEGPERRKPAVAGFPPSGRGWFRTSDLSRVKRREEDREDRDGAAAFVLTRRGFEWARAPRPAAPGSSLFAGISRRLGSAARTCRPGRARERSLPPAFRSRRGGCARRSRPRPRRGWCRLRRCARPAGRRR
jgi:hypothetical protein